MTIPGKKPLLCTLLALLVAAWGSAAVFADELIRVTHQVPGDSKPILLYADDITTWVEGNTRVLLLKGRVLAEHGIVHGRMQQAIAFIDLDKYKRAGVMQMELYAEGDVVVEQGPRKQNGPQGFVTLNTRGEVKLKAHNGKVAQQSGTDDPLYKRAQLVRQPSAGAAAPPQPSPIQRTSYQDPAEPTPPAGSLIVPASAGTVPPAPQPRAIPTQGQTPLPPGGSPPPPTPFPTNPGGPDYSQQQVPAVPFPGPPSSADPGLAPAPAPAAAPPPVLAPSPAAAPLPSPPAAPGPRSLFDGPLRQFSIQPRTGKDFQIDTIPLSNGETAIVVNDGVILNVRTNDGEGMLDIEADRLIVWTKENPQELLGGMRRPEGRNSKQLELFLSGNVEIREKQGGDTRTLRADEVYYDVGRNVAVAMKADLEYLQKGIKDPIHLQAEELHQLSPKNFRASKAEVFASRLPSDPGLKIYLSDATLDEKQLQKRSIFGGDVVDPKTGRPATEEQRLVRGKNVFLELEDVPVFYWPFVQMDANDPLGPLQNFSIGADIVYGTQVYLTLDVWDLLGLNPAPGTRWTLLTDYLSKRGPALGSNFDYSGRNLFGLPNAYQGMVRTYGIHDDGKDVLGGGRGENDDHPVWRGRALWRQNIAELPYGFTVQSQVSLLSDKNFLEQYWKNEFDTDINSETFLYVKQQQANWAWTGLVEPRIRNWVTETEALPRFDGYLIGQSFFDVLTYNAHASGGYLRLLTPDVPPPPIYPTDVEVSTGRFDLMQDLSVPFSLGALRIVPYGVLDLTEYTRDIKGDTVGRVYGGGGVRASLPFTRVFPQVQSDLFNLNGLNHKMVYAMNWYDVTSNVGFLQLPQLDRLDDDATDQALRDIVPIESQYNPGNGFFLTNSPIFNPQAYAIRRLVDNRTDTLDSIQVFQLDLRQRLQTKRGFPGQQHIVDWMMLDVSASLFPDRARDNFDEAWAFLEYDYLWNIGDRTALTSTGWYDPFDHGARVFTIGSYLNRTDRTNFFLGYRQIDPLESKAVTGSVTYIFSPKYAMTAGTTYDFGTRQNQSTELTLTRMGSDLQISLGITYNALQDNFGVKVEVIPNLIANSARYNGLKALSQNFLVGGR